jgi:uncharacterized membrane protein
VPALDEGAPDERAVARRAGALLRQARVQAQAVTNPIMPPGNVTGITPEERAALGAWIAASR